VVAKHGHSRHGGSAIGCSYRGNLLPEATRQHGLRYKIEPNSAIRGYAMKDTRHHAVLAELNRNYVRSVDEADVAWFDANLAMDFLNTNPDGILIDRKSFLAQIGRGSTVKNIREHDVLIRILGEFAIIHARTDYE